MWIKQVGTFKLFDYKPSCEVCPVIVLVLFLQRPFVPTFSVKHAAELNGIPQCKYNLKPLTQTVTKAHIYTDGGHVLLHFCLNLRATWVMCISAQFVFSILSFFGYLETYPFIRQLWESVPPADSTLYHENALELEKTHLRRINVFLLVITSFYVWTKVPTLCKLQWIFI